MKDNRVNNGSASRSWLERLSHALTWDPQDRDEFRQWLYEAVEREIIDIDTLNMIEGVLEVSEARVRDIMVPRSYMVVIDYEASLKEILPLVIKSAHSRFPIIGESRDEVRGILLAKDLLNYLQSGYEQNFHVREILRPVVFIPETKRLSILLKEFRINHNHMAIVVDEYGGVAGLVTIEDVLEQIVGDISDEYDNEEDNYIIAQGENEYIVNALTRINEFNNYFATDFSDAEFDTIGGLIINAFGRLPRKGEMIAMEGINFKILSADIRRINLIQVIINSPFDQAQE